MIPKDETLIIVSHELVSANAWAERRQLQLTWIPDQLELRVPFTQPETGLEFFLTGKFPDYKELPPFWNFCSKDWTATNEKFSFPKPKANNGIQTIFLNTPVICAPFNRLAFSEYKGPHKDWGGPSQWLACAPQYIRATTIGDMLNAIWMHFEATKGRMSDV